MTMNVSANNHSRSNLGAPTEVSDLNPTLYGYQMWADMQPDNDNFDAVDLDDYEFIQSVASGETK